MIKVKTISMTGCLTEPVKITSLLYAFSSDEHLLNYLEHSPDEANLIASLYKINCKEGEVRIYPGKKAGTIGKVTFSKTGKTLKYAGKNFQTLNGYGYKENYFDIESDEWYWISGPRRDGNDALYPMTIEIDEDIREEYWCNIRNRPDLKNTTSYRSSGKYSRKMPHPELSVMGGTRKGGNRGGWKASQKA